MRLGCPLFSRLCCGKQSQDVPLVGKPYSPHGCPGEVMSQGRLSPPPRSPRRASQTGGHPWAAPFFGIYFAETSADFHWLLECLRFSLAARAGVRAPGVSRPVSGDRILGVSGRGNSPSLSLIYCSLLGPRSLPLPCRLPSLVGSLVAGLLGVRGGFPHLGVWQMQAGAEPARACQPLSAVEGKKTWRKEGRELVDGSATKEPSPFTADGKTTTNLPGDLAITERAFGSSAVCPLALASVFHLKPSEGAVLWAYASLKVLMKAGGWGLVG